MSIKRITISVPEAVAERIKRAAGSTPVSAWVTGVIEEHLDDAELDRLWQDFYRDVRPGRDAIRKADAIMKRARRRAAAERGLRARRRGVHRPRAEEPNDGPAHPDVRG